MLSIKNRVIKNILVVFTGQTMSSIINMLISIILVNKIGFEKYGIITLGLTYINIFDTLFNFQSFNAVIKFGHEALFNKDYDLLKSYLKQALFQDLFTAMLAFMVSILFLDIAVEVFNWDLIIKSTILILSFSILFNISGSIIGLIRLFDKFNYISTINIIISVVKILLVLIGIYIDAKLLYYVKIELFSMVLSNLIYMIVALNILKKNSLLDFINTKINWDRRFLKFNLYNNLVATLDLPTGEFTKMIINQFLGSAELGLYNILVKVGNLIYKLATPIGIVIYPEFSRLIASNKISKALKLMKKIILISLVSGSLFIIIQFILYPFWSQYIFTNSISRTIVSVYFMYTVIGASFNSIHQIFTALNLIKYNIFIVLLSNLIYIILLPVLIINKGLFGLIVSLIIQSVIVIILKILIMRKHINYRIRYDYVSKVE